MIPWGASQHEREQYRMDEMLAFEDQRDDLQRYEEQPCDKEHQTGKPPASDTSRQAEETTC